MGARNYARGWGSPTQAAELLGLHRAAVGKQLHNLRDLGIATQQPNGRWLVDLDRVEQVWIESINPRRAEAEAAPTRAAAQARKEAAQAALAELELERQRGEVLPVAEVREQLFTAGRRCRDALQGIPARVHQQLAATSDPGEVLELLDREVRQVLTVLAADLNGITGSAPEPEPEPEPPAGARPEHWPGRRVGVSDEGSFALDLSTRENLAVPLRSKPS